MSMSAAHSQWLFVFFKSLNGQRFVQATAPRTKTDWTQAIRELVDVHYKHATRSVLVMDNLNTHTLGALYVALLSAASGLILI